MAADAANEIDWPIAACRTGSDESFSAGHDHAMPK